MPPGRHTIDNLKDELHDIGRRILGKEILTSKSAVELSRIEMELKQSFQAFYGKESQKITLLWNKIFGVLSRLHSSDPDPRYLDMLWVHCTSSPYPEKEEQSDIPF